MDTSDEANCKQYDDSVVGVSRVKEEVQSEKKIVLVGHVPIELSCLIKKLTLKANCSHRSLEREREWLGLLCWQSLLH